MSECSCLLEEKTSNSGFPYIRPQVPLSKYGWLEVGEVPVLSSPSRSVEERTRSKSDPTTAFQLAPSTVTLQQEQQEQQQQLPSGPPPPAAPTLPSIPFPV